MRPRLSGANTRVRLKPDTTIDQKYLTTGRDGQGLRSVRLQPNRHAYAAATPLKRALYGRGLEELVDQKQVSQQRTQVDRGVEVVDQLRAD